MNVTNFLKDHPEGELTIPTFAGNDATEEFNLIHPPDVVPKYTPDAFIGILGSDPAADQSVVASLLPGMTAYSMEKVAKHKSKKDCWVVVAGQVLVWLACLQRTQFWRMAPR